MHYITQTYVAVEVQLHTFLTSELYRLEWSDLGPSLIRLKNAVAVQVNTLRTGDADLRLHITTVHDGWRKSAFLTRAWFPRTTHFITQYMEHKRLAQKPVHFEKLQICSMWNTLVPRQRQRSGDIIKPHNFGVYCRIEFWVISTNLFNLRLLMSHIYIYIYIYIYMELLVKPEMLTSYTHGPRFGNAETVSFYLLHNVLSLNQCREVSCVTFVCKHFAS